ncbi:hypothetical protein FGO68_gene14918 [Halteria grandinella]|uniref:Transmembrane protein n=1 Tax=Halteria grandinella TaxID=5974 RepID=A0A8J8NWL0_HALGN|nr:hypothetical protein FGO68_gene14918 [Halteria grandinella]
MGLFNPNSSEPVQPLFILILKCIALFVVFLLLCSYFSEGIVNSTKEKTISTLGKGVLKAPRRRSSHNQFVKDRKFSGLLSNAKQTLIQKSFTCTSGPSKLLQCSTKTQTRQIVDNVDFFKMDDFSNNQATSTTNSQEPEDNLSFFKKELRKQFIEQPFDDQEDYYPKQNQKQKKYVICQADGGYEPSSFSE